MTEKYTTEFRVTGNDANISKINSMIQGIAIQVDDKTLQSYQTMVVVATTERADVHKILSMLASACPKNGSSPKKVYKRSTPSLTEEPTTK